MKRKLLDMVRGIAAGYRAECEANGELGVYTLNCGVLRSHLYAFYVTLFGYGSGRFPVLQAGIYEDPRGLDEWFTRLVERARAAVMDAGIQSVVAHMAERILGSGCSPAAYDYDVDQYKASIQVDNTCGARIILTFTDSITPETLAHFTLHTLALPAAAAKIQVDRKRLKTLTATILEKAIQLHTTMTEFHSVPELHSEPVPGY